MHDRKEIKVIYVKRYKGYDYTVAFYRSKGKALRGWCIDISYYKWLKISGIELLPGQHKKIEIREVEE